MKVCHVTSVHPWLDTRIYTKMVCGLSLEGIDAVLVAQNDPTNDKKMLGVDLIEPPRNRMNRLLFFRRKVVQRSLEKTPDIVHLHDPELFTYTRYFQKRGIRVVLDWHEDFVGQILNKYWIPPLLRKPLSKLVAIWCRVVTKQADASITVTPPIVKTMAFANPLLIRNFPTLRECPVSVPPQKDRTTIVYLGGVSQIRGCDTMAKAIARVAATRPIRWEIAGSLATGVDIKKLQKLAAPAVTRVLGRIDREAVASMLSCGKVGLCVIKDAHNYDVSYPTKIFEYLMWGIPVVMSRLDTLVDLFEQEVPGIFVDPANVEEVADAISFLLENPQESQRLGNLGRELVQKQFNWEADLSKLISLYQSLMKTPPRAP